MCSIPLLLTCDTCKIITLNLLNTCETKFKTISPLILFPKWRFLIWRPSKYQKNLQIWLVSFLISTKVSKQKKWKPKHKQSHPRGLNSSITHAEKLCINPEPLSYKNQIRYTSSVCLPGLQILCKIQTIDNFFRGLKK